MKKTDKYTFLHSPVNFGVSLMIIVLGASLFAYFIQSKIVSYENSSSYNYSVLHNITFDDCIFCDNFFNIWV